MNYDSCKMIKVDSRQAVESGVPGSFFFEDAREGEHAFKRIWVKLPHELVGAFNLEPAPDHLPAVWKWNHNESKPTIWMEHGGKKLDIHMRGQWHGRIQNGRMASLEKPPAKDAPQDLTPKALPPPLPIPQAKAKRTAVKAAVKKGIRRS